jgi:polyphosphate kinase 2 (PPK2 family)
LLIVLQGPRCIGQGQHDQVRDERSQPSGRRGPQLQEAVAEDLERDFLRRYQAALPGKGRIGLFKE